MKRTARANKRASFKKFIQELDTKSPVDFAKKMKALVRSKKVRKSENGREGRPLDPAEMTGFLHNQYQPTRTTIIAAEQFMVTKHMRRELKKALIRAPAKKATGPDGVFAEALRIEAELSSKFILATVSKVGELGYMPKSMERNNNRPYIQREWRPF